MAIKKIITLFILVVLLIGCNTTKVTVSVLKAPQVRVSVPLEKIAVINRVNQTANTKQFVNGHIVTQFNGITPIMVNEATRQLNQRLIRSFYIQSFDTTLMVLPADQNFNRSLPIAARFNAACKALQVDAIITVDGFDANVDSDSEVRYSTPVDRTYGTVQVPYFEGQQSVEMRMLFRLHTCADSAIYEDEIDLSTQKSMATSGSNYYEIKNKQRESASILIQAARQIGTDYVDYIAPENTEEIRKIYHKGNSQMEQAFQFVTQNNWKAAADIWYLQATSSSNKMAMWATYNLITANEMMGVLDEAHQLAQLYNQKFPGKDAAHILYRIEKRQQEMKYMARVYPRLIVQ